ncbi:extracellular solute-binding protein [Candidatus Laterigemmans baculatus]|uniref:extracellular solute-binding protein n=1 Tax=Candidatus Laterigemmans baculatus TaxID=2770505 RepID=UPI0013D9F1F7|nr:extracellular solute-binding protein [Candidatus Laterigemmans baculatus]
MPTTDRSPQPLRTKLSLPLGAFLVGLFLVGFAGCNRAPSTVAPPAEEATDSNSSDVPLRIVSTAPTELNERIEAAWKSVSEQPLTITAATRESLAEHAERTDVVLFQTAAMGDLQAADLLTPLPESFLQSEAVDADSLLPSLAGGAMRWGDEMYALPLGSAQPAVWISPDIDTADSLTWQEYSERIAKLPAGQAAEPLADGWAAIALLHRASTQTSATWLFERNTLAPVLESPPYVRALEQLVADRQQYPEELLSPAELWDRLQAGQLRVAIGWPVGGEATAASSLRMLPYPTAEEVFIDQWKPAEVAPRPPLLSPRGLVVSVAASCRQTAAARVFLAWLASREGHAVVRAASSDLAVHRAAVLSEEDAALPIAQAADLGQGTYDAYVRQTLGDGQVRPTLRIPGSDAYLEALDAQVVRALLGEATAEEALAAASEEWEAITERLGRQKQLRAWRQAQGLRIR